MIAVAVLAVLGLALLGFFVLFLATGEGAARAIGMAVMCVVGAILGGLTGGWLGLQIVGWIL